MWLAEIEQLRPLFDAFNAGVQRARDEYAAHPTVSCMGMVTLRDGTEHPCPNTRHRRDVLCNRCRIDTAATRYLEKNHADS